MCARKEGLCVHWGMRGGGDVSAPWAERGRRPAGVDRLDRKASAQASAGARRMCAYHHAHSLAWSCRGATMGAMPRVSVGP